MSNDNAYTVTFRGVQLGDEAFGWDAMPAGGSARVTTPLGSARAHVSRRTPGAHTRHRLTVHLLGRGFTGGPELIEQWGQMIDGEAGELRIRRGGTTVARVPNALLELVQPQASNSPAATTVRIVVLDFVTAEPIA